ncbi:hypothetical protein N7447_006067 [Penicillium robsamsonii]|uniref:uncharacterized protein n=1 Tax=Penicillium robsamsonii TaxID=1792511 RepID=UPI0025472433|nr:uncharacterized protein N7447_006067 [Penicillium robsamsonii]KAJ5823727.1 hypothetical protein N7447_006067 [Penicillium robsamsonii]
MQYKLASISLLAGMASAIPSSSPSPTPASLSPSFSSMASISAVPSVSAPIASNTPGVVNPKDYDCVYRGWGCDWRKSEYGYGSDYCGLSPFEAGQQLKRSKVVAVSKDGSGDCASKAGNMCCQVLAKEPCRRGEKYLECRKPE